MRRLASVPWLELRQTRVRGRSRVQGAQVQEQLGALTTAFLDLERQLTQIDAAVAPAREINRTRRPLTRLAAAARPATSDRR